MNTIRPNRMRVLVAVNEHDAQVYVDDHPTVGEVAWVTPDTEDMSDLGLVGILGIHSTPRAKQHPGYGATIGTLQLIQAITPSTSHAPFVRQPETGEDPMTQPIVIQTIARAGSHVRVIKTEPTPYALPDGLTDEEAIALTLT